MSDKMKKDEALTLVGKTVFAHCWVGSYIGTLKEVIIRPHKPWRGIVIIKAIAEFPFPTWGSFVKPLRYNMERSFGHSSIALFNDGEIPDYKKSMIDTHTALLKQLEKHPDSLVQKGVKSLKEFEWLVNHPDYMGGWKTTDMPELQNKA